MGRSRREQITAFANGVITTFYDDMGPSDSASIGENSTLTKDGAGNATVSVRPGWTQLLNQYGRAYKRLGAYRYYDSATLKDGPAAAYLASVYTWDNFGTFTYDVRLHSPSTGSVSATDTMTPGSTLLATIPAMVQANNMLFTAGGKAGTLRKFRSTTASKWGIAAPGTAPTISDSGVAGSHTGTYEARVTFYNSVTGHESSAGTTSSTVTVTGKQLSWSSIPTSLDSQVTDRKLYLRNTGTMSSFYLVATLAGNVATTTTTNVSDSLLVTAGPDSAENNPPPDNAFLAAWHKSRMFLSDGVYVYFSKLGNPEAFDPDSYEQIDTNDGGGVITNIVSHEGDLVIFKERATYAILGDDPNTWEIRQVDPSVGCVGGAAAIAANGQLFVWTHRGPAIFAGGQFTFIGQELLAQTLATLNRANALGVVAGVDEDSDVVMWAVPLSGSTSNTIIIPYNYKLNRFEASKWDPFLGVAAMTAVADVGSGGVPTPYLATATGQLFKGGGTTDGLASGTTTGTTTATGTSTTSFTDGSATFTTAAVPGLTVRFFTSDGTQVGSSLVTGGTGTSLSFSPAITTVIGTTYTYTVGRVPFRWKTQLLHFGSPFTMKRWQFLRIEGANGATVRVYSNDSPSTPEVTASITNEVEKIRLGFSSRSIQVEVIYPVATAGTELIARMEFLFEEREDRFQ